MLSKILGNWLKSASTNDDQAKVNNLPKHEQSRLMVDNIATRKGRPFNPIKAATVQLQCINTDVVALIARIDQYAGKLELSEALAPKDCFAEVKSVTLDQFFTDSQGMYIPLSTVDDFVHSAQRLFAAIDRGLSHKNRDVEYSLRLMGKCFTSIQNVCKAIEEAAQ